LQSHETLLRVWVLLRPLLAVPPWPTLLVGYAVTCVIAYKWKWR
jgi:hypothetical protein